MAYFKTTITAGKTIEVHKSFTKFNGKKAKGCDGSLSPEQIEKINELNAEAKLARKINANFTEGDFHLILTYKKELRPLPQQAKKNVSEFMRSMRKEYKKFGADFKYIQVTEYETTAIHHHLVINDVEGQRIEKLVRSLWKFGGPKFVPLDNCGQYRELAEYLIKETARTHKKKNGGQMQRYSCSRNLINPKPKTQIIKKANSWQADPKPLKGYYIDPKSLFNGVNPFTCREYQKYTMIKIPEKKGRFKNGG